MKIAAIYFGSLKSRFARSQDWSRFGLVIAASEHLGYLQPAREQGTGVFSYTHRQDTDHMSKLYSRLNDGLFLDWASAPADDIDSLAERLHDQGKKLVVNTGWGGNKKVDFGSADILLLESFIGTNSGDDGKWPVTYSRRDRNIDVGRLRQLKDRGYQVISLSYGPGDDRDFAMECHDTAEANGSDFFIYVQAPGWEKEGSGLRLFVP